MLFRLLKPSEISMIHLIVLIEHNCGSHESGQNHENKNNFRDISFAQFIEFSYLQISPILEKREGGVKIMLFVSVHAHVQADILLYEAQKFAQHYGKDRAPGILPSFSSRRAPGNSIHGQVYLTCRIWRLIWVVLQNRSQSLSRCGTMKTVTCRKPVCDGHRPIICSPSAPIVTPLFQLKYSRPGRKHQSINQSADSVWFL